MKYWKGLTAMVAAVSVLAPAPPASADVETVGAEKDNTLYPTTDGSLSNGLGEYFFAGRTDQSDEDSRRRGVVAFDLSTIPAGSTINSVTLTLRMSRTQAGSENVTVHRLLADWGEGTSIAGGNEGTGASSTTDDATWKHTFYDTQFWASDGGDYQATASANANVGGNGFYDWSSGAMVADVQHWLDNPAQNYGWIVIGNESTNKTAKRFDSLQNGNESRRPALTIDFTPPASTGACCFGDGNCQILSSTDCTNQGGAYEGDGTSCNPNPCPQPEGACCFLDESCLVLTQDDCGTAGGSYQGDDTVCVPNPCLTITGACCFSGAVCLELSPSDCVSQSGDYQGDGTTCTPNPCPLNLEPFRDPLPIPGVLSPVDPGPPAFYQVDMTEFQQQLHRDLPTTTVWGYNGTFPGPIIQVNTDEPVQVEWINDLPAQHHLPVDTCPHGADDDSSRTVVHLHGGHVPADVDGYPEDTFLPGNSVVYEYPNNQQAAPLWFHDHALGITRLNVYMGLAGIYIVRDAIESALNLPTGEFEIPLVIQDRVLDQQGQLVYPAAWEEMYFGDLILVNGKVWPYLDVQLSKYRFRMLNGSNSRTYTLTLDPPPPPDTWWQIGTDGGLLPAPVALTELTIGPGERADVVIDFSNYGNGDNVVLTNSAPAPYPGSPGVGVVPNVMQFRVSMPMCCNDPLPATLREVTPLLEEDTVQTRQLILKKEAEACAGSHWLINGLKWDDITEYPVMGTTELWEFVNDSGVMHPMHLHLDFFQILNRQAFVEVDGEIVPVGDPIPPDPNEAGWKDTARVNPQEILRVIAQFHDYLGKYPYHCHILEHEDHEMMRQFQVVLPCPWDCQPVPDGIVNIPDFLALLAQWGQVDTSCDINGGGVDVTDFLEILAFWGPCP
jgi:spore coat protein A